MNPLHQRLLEFINHLGCSVLSFENRCKIAPGTVSKMSEKSRERTFDKIQAAFPQLSIKWLKTGEGEMLKSQYNQTVYGGEKIVQHGSITECAPGVADNLTKCLEAIAKATETNAQTLKSNADILESNAKLLTELSRSNDRLLAVLEKLTDHLISRP